MKRFSVLGTGGWGTAMAVHLSRTHGDAVTLWGNNPETVRQLIQQRENVRQLPGIAISDSINIITDVVDAVKEADCILVAIPMAHLRSTLKRFSNVRAEVPVVSLTKGIENGTFLRPTEIIAEVLGAETVAVMSGPSHAEEVALGKPTSVVIASKPPAMAETIRDAIHDDRLRIYTSDDLIGIELAAALKNVMGLAAGICDGLGFGDNAKAALLTRGSVEMMRFGLAHGAQPTTFLGLAGIGDLITTCFSKHGRNRRAGERLTQGTPLEELLSGPQAVEGTYTARSVQERIERENLDSPIMTGVYRVLYEGCDPAIIVQDLMNRQPRDENLSL